MQDDIIFPLEERKNGNQNQKDWKNVADKLTELAKKKGVSRETYIRDYLNTLAVAPELKEMDFKYANLVETLADQARMYADIIDKNNYILDEVLERLDALEKRKGMINVVKKYVLDQECIDTISKVKADKEFKNDSATLRYIIQEYQKNEQQKENDAALISGLLESYNQKYYALFERLRWASQTAEMNTTILLDAINTILIKDDVRESILREAIQAPVIADSQNAYKEKIAYFKQQKDDRNKKKAMKK